MESKALVGDVGLQYQRAFENFQENGPTFILHLALVSVFFTTLLGIFTHFFSRCGCSPKFVHYNIKALWHLIAAVWGYFLLSEYSWGFVTPCTSPDSSSDFIDHDRATMRPIYLAQCGYYIGSIVVTMYEGQRGDILPVVIHHAITFFLIGFSWFLGYHRWGLVVYFWVDLGDAVLYYLKVLEKCGSTVILVPYFFIALFGFAYSKVYRIFHLSYQVSECIHKYRPEESLISVDWGFCFALSGLGSLMLWYTYKLILIVVRYAKTGEAKDTLTEKSKKE